MNFFFLFVILSYLFYSFLKCRKKEEDNPVVIKKGEAEYYYEKVIVAVIATLMENKKYHIKRIMIKPDINERRSLWKIKGRGENHLKYL